MGLLFIIIKKSPVLITTFVSVELFLLFFFFLCFFYVFFYVFFESVLVARACAR